MGVFLVLLFVHPEEIWWRRAGKRTDTLCGAHFPYARWAQVCPPRPGWRRCWSVL